MAKGFIAAMAIALLGAPWAGSPAHAQAIAVGASVECDPVGVGNYRSGIVKEVLPAGQGYKVDLDDYTPTGDLFVCPANRLRAVPRDAFLKGPPAAFGIFHSGDRIECGVAANGVPAPGSVVTLLDPKGVYAVLFDGTEPGGAPRTCEGSAMKRFSGLPVGGMGFKK
jgi:hypothetical protein